MTNTTNISQSKSNPNSRKRAPKKINPKTSFDIAYSNIRGLRTNFMYVEPYINSKKPDMLALCETNLNPEISEKEFDIPGYCSLSVKHDHLQRHMHGLAVYIKEGIPCARDTSFESPDQPFMCFRMALLHSTSFIFFLYRPHHDNLGCINSISTNIDKVLCSYPSANIHVCGDFNAHHMEWLIHSNKSDDAGVGCYEFALSHDLKQLIDYPTRIPDAENQFSSLLDLFLTSCPDECKPSPPHPPFGTSDHVVISVTVNFPPKQSTEVPFHRTVYRYRKADWDSFRFFLADMPVSRYLQMNASEATALISDWITAGIDLFVPHKKYQQKPHSQPWFTPGCASAIAHRNHHFHKYNRNKCQETKSEYKAASRRCSRILRQAVSAYQENVHSKIQDQRLGSREFWKITNTVLHRGKSAIPTLLHGPEVLSSSADKASLFADMFASNGNLDDSNHPVPVFELRTESVLSSVKFKVSEVKSFISALAENKATGPDKIPIIVLKNTAPELAPILTKLFNRCISEGCFPIFWKQSSVCPVFKNSGERTDPNKYRPVSLLSVISKLFEAVINLHLKRHLEKNGLLSDVQYGFRPSRSTADVLTVITERISKCLDKSYDSRAIALDISKAFDKVWHKGLLCKIKSYGICGRLYNIIASFLRDRSMRVVIDGQSSDTHSLNAGVPQGSVLGPTLFLLFINDLPDQNLKSLIDIFADDTTIYQSAGPRYSHSQLASDLSHDLAKIVEWGDRWLITFNAAKTKLLSFHHHRTDHTFPSIQMNGLDLEEQTSFDRLLGLEFTSDLRWNKYITEVSKAVSKMIGSFYRSRKFLSNESILYLYKSQIRPKMEYCSHVWGGAARSSLNILDRLQHRMKYLVGEELYSTLQPLSHRRNVASLSLFYRYFHGKCSDELKDLVPARVVNHHITRSSVASADHPYLLRVPGCRRNFHARTFFPHTTTLWNSLPPDCFPAQFNLGLFKSNVNKCVFDT